MQAYLILANGRILKGKSLGCQGTTVGEVVFATGMVGFEETLTDPSYYGQIITQTYPLIGNYGMNSEDKESGSAQCSFCSQGPAGQCAAVLRPPPHRQWGQSTAARCRSRHPPRRSRHKP